MRLTPSLQLPRKFLISCLLISAVSSQGVAQAQPNSVQENQPTCSTARGATSTAGYRQAATFSDRPRQVASWADPTNYGERFRQDIYGKPVSNQWLVVLHETVSSGRSAINFFQTPHPNENDQASYHALILRDGTIVYLVPPEKRAFGAGNSVFVGANGPEAVKTHPKFPASVNNFAYHISLETPADGNNNSRTHSGYTSAQYRSLAWLVAQTGVPDARVTTHKAVDRSGERLDPRSFNNRYFMALLQSYRQTNQAQARCSPI